MEKQYETVIGLEVHVELATKTKIFCACSTAFGAAPNTHTCPVCTGMPGTLPVLNKQVVEYAMAVGTAFHCDINSHCQFDRKNYFYPDNPQNYQISQWYLPICKNGYVEISISDQTKKIGIHQIHMEEDAGKLIHDEERGCSLIDYNRAGVPLIEIVSEPDMSSADEVILYLEKLRTTIQYLGASDCKLNEGSMRADVNLSVRPVGEKKLGTRTEMKNLNSFKAIVRAINTERDRQISCLEKGKEIVQETRRWDDNKGCSYVMRTKEDGQDYRYFPEPDLPPLYISRQWIQKVKEKQPEFQEEKMIRFQEQYSMSEYDVRFLTASKALSDLFEDTVSKNIEPKKVANWLMGELPRLMREKDREWMDLPFTSESLATLILLTENGTINLTVAKEVFEKMFEENIDVEKFVEDNKLGKINDESVLRSVIENVISENPQSVADYEAGKKKAIGFLVGKTMKATQGRADPNIVHKILYEILQK